MKMHPTQRYRTSVMLISAPAAINAVTTSMYPHFEAAMTVVIPHLCTRNEKGKTSDDAMGNCHTHMRADMNH